MLDFTSEDDAGEFDFDYDAEALLSAIVGVRAELAAGDLRPLYLAWLAAYGAWERDEDVFDRDADDDLEPPVPPGLGTLTAAQRALADFLRVDDDLLAIAAQTSPPLEETADDDLAAWVSRLPVATKNRLLPRVVQGEAARVRMEMLRRFRDDTAPTISVPARRTVADLLDNAARRRADHDRRLAAKRAEDAARREQARALARERRLDELADEEDAAWSRVDAMIATRKPAEYDAAVITAHRSAGARRTRGPLRHVHPTHHRTAADACTQTQPHRTPQPRRHLNSIRTSADQPTACPGSAEPRLLDQISLLGPCLVVPDESPFITIEPTRTQAAARPRNGAATTFVPKIGYNRCHG